MPGRLCRVTVSVQRYAEHDQLWFITVHPFSIRPGTLNVCFSLIGSLQRLNNGLMNCSREIFHEVSYLHFINQFQRQMKPGQWHYAQPRILSKNTHGSLCMLPGHQIWMKQKDFRVFLRMQLIFVYLIARWTSPHTVPGNEKWLRGFSVMCLDTFTLDGSLFTNAAL